MEPALVQRRGEGADEPGAGGDLGERAEALLASRVMEEPGHDRFLREAARRGQAFAGERGKGEAVGERVERSSPETEERSSLRRELPEEVIGGLERRRNEQHGSVAFDLREPEAPRFPSGGRPWRDHDAMRRHVDVLNINLLASIPEVVIGCAAESVRGGMS
jgi:hypothetical protein